MSDAMEELIVKLSAERNLKKSADVHANMFDSYLVAIVERQAKTLSLLAGRTKNLQEQIGNLKQVNEILTDEMKKLKFDLKNPGLREQQERVRKLYR